MKLVTLDVGHAGSLGAIVGTGEVLHLSKFAQEGGLEALLPETMIGLLSAGQQALQVVHDMVSRCEALGAADKQLLSERGILTPFAGTPLLAPVPRPGLVFAAGLNYRDHLQEMKNTPTPKHPSGFLKSPASITGPGAPVLLPPQCPDMVDYEGELAFIFGRRCHAVSAEDALQYVAGFTVFNDVSARDWAAATMGPADPWPARLSWEINVMGKQFVSFSPMGPALVTTDEIADSNALSLTTRLNGRVMQSSTTANLVFSVAEIIAYFSRWYTFMPGDVISTGTPSGVGFGRTPPVFMKSGDVVEVEISGLGVLTNPVV